MSVGISIQVDATQVREAKKMVQFLNKALRETEEHGGIDLGDDRLADTSAMVKRLSEDIRRLRSIAASGDRNGGLIRRDQLQEAEKLSTRIRENFSGYSAVLGKAREELGRLIQERRTLGEMDGSGKYESPQAYLTRKERMETLQGAISEKQAALQRLEKYRPRLAGLQREGAEAAGAISGFGPPGLGPQLLQRTIAAGATLFAGLSVVNLFREAFDTAKLFAPLESDLMLRGGRDLRENAATYGFRPIEHLHAADLLNRRLGFGGMELNEATEAAKRFSRGFGLSVGTTSEYAAGIHQSLGLSAPLFEKHLNRLTAAVEKAGVGGRVEEYLRQNQELLHRVSQGMGGRELSDREASWITSLQASTWAQRGMIGKGTSGVDFLSRVHEGIRGGGRTPGEQLFLFQALNGGDIRSLDDYERFLERREAGIGSPDNLRDILNTARHAFGSDGRGGLSTLGRMNLHSIFGLTVEQTKLASRMLAGGDFSESSISRFVQGGDITGRAGLAMQLPGNDHRLQEARIEAKELGPGSGIMQGLDLLKKGALDSADALGALTDRARKFLRPEPSEEDRRHMSVMGIGGQGSPYKMLPLDEPAWARELTGEIRALREATEKQDSQIRRVEVVNPTPALPPFPTPSPKGSGR